MNSARVSTKTFTTETTSNYGVDFLLIMKHSFCFLLLFFYVFFVLFFCLCFFNLFLYNLFSFVFTDSSSIFNVSFLIFCFLTFFFSFSNLYCTIFFLFSQIVCSADKLHLEPKPSKTNIESSRQKSTGKS